MVAIRAQIHAFQILDVCVEERTITTGNIIQQINQKSKIMLCAATMETDFYSNACTTRTTMGTLCVHSYTRLYAVLHNNGNRLLMISGVTSLDRGGLRLGRSLNVVECYSACYRASSEQDTSSCVAVLSSLWEIVTDSHC
jgi:hypothetical protein